ncbi:MAG: glycosyltransferase family 2 protein [Desulfuromonas sp.]|nr:MAG: glycosyltransferase family 2 protein [Desulfuromonas sp.]
MKRVYVVIVNWNGWADTIECLESLFRLDYPDYRIIVCDNGSTDDSFGRLVDWAEGRLAHVSTPDFVSRHHQTAPPVKKPIKFQICNRAEAEAGGCFDADPPLVLIRAGENLGFAGGNNIALRYAMARDDFSHAWLLNNDTVVESGALQALVERMSEKPSAGICGSTLALYDRPDQIQARAGGWYCRWIGLPWHLGQLGKVSQRPRVTRVERWMNYVVGASMLVSRDFLVDVGLMCEDYFLFFEETDWALRGGERFTLAYAPESVVYHKVGRSIGTSSDPRRKSPLCDYYAIRNRLRFTRRYFPEALPTVWLTVAMAVLVRLLLGRIDRALMLLQLLLGRDVPPPEKVRVA